MGTNNPMPPGDPLSSASREQKCRYRAAACWAIGKTNAAEPGRHIRH
jgi:hypothetical protein